MSFLFTFSGYLLGVPVLLFILLLIIIQNLLNNQRLFDPLLKFLCRLIPRLFGIRIRVSGFENLDRGKNYLFISNHINIFDGLILYGYIPHFIRGVELESHFSWPIWGAITRRLGNIPISHKNVKEALVSLDRAAEVINKGLSILIFPEGHRTRDGGLQTFMRGPFRLVKKTQADIMPIVFKGAWERKNIKTRLVTPGSMEIIFGSPLSHALYSGLSDRELRDKSRMKIKEMLR